MSRDPLIELGLVVQTTGTTSISQNKSTYLKRPDFYNKKLVPYPLEFNMSDIEAIFISKEAEIAQISDEFDIHVSKIKISDWKPARPKR